MPVEVSAEGYDRYLGPYSELLAEHFLALAGVAPGHRALDVGCGPGALTRRLADRLGPEAVAAIDPVPVYVEAASARCPGVVVRHGHPHLLPFDDAEYDAVLAQLVVHTLPDPVAALREMGRVAGPDGTVAACVWDHAGQRGPSSVFWSAVRGLEPDVPGEAVLPGAAEDELRQLAEAAGLRVVAAERLEVQVHYPTFQDWWEQHTLDVGRVGAHIASCVGDCRERLRDECRRRLPAPPFDITASAWAVVARPERRA